MSPLKVLPDGWSIAERDDGFYVVDREGGEIMGPFPSADAALEAYADEESRPA